eukprot:5074264-Amphidinium_carterae.1
MKSFYSAAQPRVGGVGILTSLNMQPLWRDSSGRAAIAAITRGASTLVVLVFYGMVNDPDSTNAMLE